MSDDETQGATPPELLFAARYAAAFRQQSRPLEPPASVETLRSRFCVPLPEEERDGLAVVRDLIDAAEPGLVGNTAPGFFAWVMGGSHPTGVAADWLTSAWGQNAAIYQCSPAAAVAEEAAARWIVELLGLPPESSVGFTTGATMAGFVALAAARGDVLRRAGYDFERCGLAGAPPVTVYIGDDAHATNFAALRYLGFGSAQIRRIRATDAGVMDVDALAAALAEPAAARIVVAQAGHINTGAFDDFGRIADLCHRHDAWLHVDGAFGLWVRVSPALRRAARGVERADSWSVDGHKWLQVPYDSGFVIVRDAAAHRRAMDVTAGYLNQDAGDGRNPTAFNPELSRRARGFAVWAMLQRLGRRGLVRMVENHCGVARELARRLAGTPGIEIRNHVVLNQVLVRFGAPGANATAPLEVARRLNAAGRYFFRPAEWRGETLLRVSVIGPGAHQALAATAAAEIVDVWRAVERDRVGDARAM
jgi:glutamate/tyrosine decarboxylase-like PLP-dependent enzyme